MQKEVFPFGGVQAGDVLRLFLRGNFAGGKNDMKTEKRVLSLVLVFSMIASLFLTAVPVSAAGKTVDSGIWYGLEEKPESKADPSGAGGLHHGSESIFSFHNIPSNWTVPKVSRKLQ